MKQRSQRNRRNRALERPNVDGIHIRTASVDDAAAIAEIYNQGIEDRVATYETKRRSAEDQQAWLQAIAGRYPAVVAQIDGEIIGWAGAGPYRERECYRGIGEFSMYVHRDWRRRGVGDLLARRSHQRSGTAGVVETAIAHLSFQRGQSRALSQTRIS